ncbi:MAG: primosomal protein N', partial [Rhodospirillaceae bacterium]
MSGADDGVFAPGQRISVLLPLPLGTAYDYAVPDGLTQAAGDYVRVPLGPRRVSGVVWGPGAGDVDAAKLRAVAARHAMTPLPDVSRRFVEWVARYT